MFRPFCISPKFNESGFVKYRLEAFWISLLDLFSNLSVNDRTKNSVDNQINGTNTSNSLLSIINGKTCLEDTLFVWIPILLLVAIFSIELLLLKSKKFNDNEENNKKKSVIAPRPSSTSDPLPLTIFYLIKLVLKVVQYFYPFKLFFFRLPRLFFI